MTMARISGIGPAWLLESDPIFEMVQDKATSMAAFGIPFNVEIQLCTHWLLSSPQG
jgi:hypothetical protein